MELPVQTDRYTLSGDDKIRSRVTLMNGNPLTLGENDELSALEPVIQPADTMELVLGTCTLLCKVLVCKTAKQEFVLASTK